MIESAIANWLTKTNERNYQIPYCQVLLSKGQRVLYVSTHRPMEQGKDIITEDSSGNYHAYQLKTGDIDQKTFRAIKGEIEELVERSIVHPSVEKSKGHRAYLVLNGQITDEVRYLIDQMNADNIRRDRRVAHLDVITKHGLLQDFIAAQGQFLPTTIDELGMLLDVYNADGTDVLPVDRVFRFFEEGLFVQTTAPKQQARNAIAASVISTGYLLRAFQRSNNWYALFQAWTILAACILRYAWRCALDPRDWNDSLELARAAADAALQNLWEEGAARENFLEGNDLVDGGDIYRARVTMLMGAFSAYALRSSTFDRPEFLKDLVLENRRHLWLWGESAFPLVFSVARFLEHMGEANAGLELLAAMLEITTTAFTSLTGPELAAPYYPAARILHRVFDPTGKEQQELRSCGGSFILRPIIELLARRNARDRIASRWTQASKVPVREVRPKNAIDLFTWRTANATNVTEILPRKQSWRSLQEAACRDDGALDVLRPYVAVLHYFTIVCPYRATPDVIRLIDGYNS